VSDLVLLDTALPDLSGFEVCRRIRAGAVTPQPAVVILTAQTGESERVAGFEVGADDFVSKPFSLRELMLRSRSGCALARPPSSQLSLNRPAVKRLTSA